jgi:hypothetical protein
MATIRTPVAARLAGSIDFAGAIAGKLDRYQNGHDRKSMGVQDRGLTPADQFAGGQCVRQRHTQKCQARGLAFG